MMLKEWMIPNNGILFLILELHSID